MMDDKLIFGVLLSGTGTGEWDMDWACGAYPDAFIEVMTAVLDISLELVFDLFLEEG